ncbi:MAG: hypothetical protein ABIP79_02235 [Chitinophagaceae bacterium]
MKWIGLTAGILLIIACFTPWVFIASRNITISGVEATGTSFGKPGYFHLLCAFFFLLFHFIPRIWAKRSNLLVAALNMAWAIRNFFVIAACQGGECPEKKIGLYLASFASVVMLITTVFPDMKIISNKNKSR